MNNSMIHKENKMPQKHTDEEIWEIFRKQIPLKKKQEIAGTIATAHEVMDGRDKTEQEANEATKSKTKEKFFGKPGRLAHCENP